MLERVSLLWVCPIMPLNNRTDRSLLSHLLQLHPHERAQGQVRFCRYWFSPPVT
jgi:hypothetical protein